jgi:parallel beta-helix repeat protein
VYLAVDIIDHPGNCIAIDNDNVTFDCGGHQVDGDDLAIDLEDGIFVGHSSGVTIRNCSVSGFSNGLHLFNSSGSTITNNNFSGNGSDGIHIANSSLNTISGNTINDNTQGITFSTANKNTINSNTVCNKNRDFNIYSGTGNSGDNNTCNIPNGWNDIGTTGCTSMCAGTTTCNSCATCSAKLNGDFDTVLLTADISNQTGNCIEFNADNVVFDCQDQVIDGDDVGTDYGISILSHFGNTVKDCEIRDFYEGILLVNADDNTIHNNHSWSNDNDGIRLENSDDNLIAYFNRFTGNRVYGISFLRSHRNDIFFNDVIANLGGGIHFDESNRNDIASNTVGDNINTDSWGITLAAGSEFNHVTGNEVIGNYAGIQMMGNFTYNNYINSNTVCSSSIRDLRQWDGATSSVGDLALCRL